MTDYMYELPDGLLTSNGGAAAEAWADECYRIKDIIRRYQTARTAMDKFNADRNVFEGSIAERNHRNNELFQELLAARDGLMWVE